MQRDKYRAKEFLEKQEAIIENEVAYFRDLTINNKVKDFVLGGYIITLRSKIDWNYSVGQPILGAKNIRLDLQQAWLGISDKEYIESNIGITAYYSEMQFYLAYNYLLNNLMVLNKIGKLIKEIATQNAVIQFMTLYSGLQANSDIAPVKSDVQDFELIEKAIESSTKVEQTNLLKKYIHTYPKIHNTHFPWPHDYEAITLKDTYIPTWHFNVAAISIMLGLDIEDFADEPFYPIELARYCLAQRQNKS